jgi:hypothetical protein
MKIAANVEALLVPQDGVDQTIDASPQAFPIPFSKTRDVLVTELTPKKSTDVDVSAL